jgi:uncharacterized membrane protein
MLRQSLPVLPASLNMEAITMFSKNRIEALSDGVFAITMTLLVLDLKIPEGTAPAMLGAAIRHEGHAWFSFFVTFAIASMFWTMQHRVFDLMQHMSHETLIPTFVFLGFVAVLPFSTHVLGNYVSTPLAFFIYFLNQLAIAVALTVKLELARHHGHLRTGPESKILRIRLYTMCVAMASGVIGARFLSPQWIGIGPVVIGLTSKRIRAIQAARLKENGTPAI